MKVNLKMNPAIATSVTFTDEEPIDKPRIGINYEGSKLYAPMGLGWYGSLKGLYNNIYSGQHPALLGKSHKEESGGDKDGVNISLTTTDFKNWNIAFQILPEFWDEIDPNIQIKWLSGEVNFYPKTGTSIKYMTLPDIMHLNYGDTGTFEFTKVTSEVYSPADYYADVRLQIVNMSQVVVMECYGCPQDYSDGKLGDVFRIRTQSTSTMEFRIYANRTVSGRSLSVTLTRTNPADIPLEFGYFRGTEWIKLGDLVAGTTTTVTLPDDMIVPNLYNLTYPFVYIKRTDEDKVCTVLTATQFVVEIYGTWYADSMAHNAIFEY